jgi:hypothetical protein
VSSPCETTSSPPRLAPVSSRDWSVSDMKMQCGLCCCLHIANECGREVQRTARWRSSARVPPPERLEGVLFAQFVH